MSTTESYANKANEELNGDTQLYFGPLQYFGRCRGCNNNLAANDPASQYQRQKIIQNQVRVMSSLYSMNLKALNAYQRPITIPETIATNGVDLLLAPGVNWNQMSDRRLPHRQNVKTASGTNPGGNSVRHVVTRLRPGALSPGGVGVDIKHNSYERYLNRIKGKAPLRRGVIPPNYGREFIPFNPAFPIYGGKVIKTGLINGCNCPEVEKPPSPNEELLYTGAVQDEIYNVRYEFSENERVLILKPGPFFRRYGIIEKVLAADFLVRLENGEAGYFTNAELILVLKERCPVDPCVREEARLFTIKELADNQLLVANGILKALEDRNQKR